MQFTDRPIPPRSLVVIEKIYTPDKFIYGNKARHDGTNAYLSYKYDYVEIAGLDSGTYEIKITARGDYDGINKPVFNIWLGALLAGTKLAETVIPDSVWRDHVFSGIKLDGRNVIFAMMNDYWDPVTDGGVNMWIAKITFVRISADTYNIVGNSFIVSWLGNREPDMLKYRSWLGHAHRAYFTFFFTTDTSFKFTNLPTDTLYHVAVTAIDTAMNESDFSEEKKVRLLANNTSPACDLNGDGKITISDFTLADMFQFKTRRWIEMNYSGPDSVAILNAFDRLDLNKNREIESSELTLFDRQCKF